jgi:glycosyltransferase involved in cell wall biosynthesis
MARDYESLIKAVDGLDVKVVIAANSPWMGGENKHTSHPVPDNVKFVKCTPSELRELYAKAMFTAIPLYPVNIQAGSLVIYESMAMGKAVVTTSNGGNVDIVRHGETGYYVPAQDPQALRENIIRLLDNPQEAERLGSRAREVVEDGLNMDVYVQNIERIVRETYERDMSKVV